MKMPLIVKVIIVYLTVVFCAAAANWLHFQCDPSSFVLSEHLNRRIARYELKTPDEGLALYLKRTRDTIPIAIDEFNALVFPLFEELDSIDDSLVFQKAVCETDSLTLDSLTTLATVLRSDSIAVYTKNELSNYQRKIDDIKLLMNGRDSIELTLEGKYVDLAQAQLEFAIKNAELQSSIFDRYASFVPETLSEEIRESNNHLIESWIILQRLQWSRQETYRKIKELSAAFNNKRLSIVRFFDFLYYSFCVSTTVSFGEIVPNDLFTRVTTLIELLLCVGLVGYIVNYFAPEKKKKRGKDNK